MPAWAAAAAAVTMASAPAVVLLTVEESNSQGQVTERIILHTALSSAAAFVVFAIVLGIVLQPSLPPQLQPYLPIAIVAAMDAIFGGFRAYLDRVFDDKVFVVSFVSNVLIAALIVWVGDLIGVGTQLSTAVVVVLGIRIFTNVAAIRRKLFHA